MSMSLWDAWLSCLVLINGWKEILMAVGFRFEPSSNGLPAAVFFPQSDPGLRLVKCSSNLQALLGMFHDEKQRVNGIGCV